MAWTTGTFITLSGNDFENIRRQTWNVRKIQINKGRPCVLELAFNDYRRVHADKIGGHILFHRKSYQMFGIVFSRFAV
ncbi:MAG: hypothetical protein MZV70_58615 [Desulfobacterales bacterium]|nr:hypothetical protein [Desulfobacterales bacterium]